MFTGFPGFLGSALLPRVLARDPDARAACLVQPKFADLARRRVGEIVRAHPTLAGRVDLVAGDVTVPGLGLAGGAPAPATVTEVYHLAAVYDLSVARDLAMRVNIGGTRHVLDYAADCPHLDRLHYMSTCFVSGTTPGAFTEDDLERGQGFHNHYEETKFLAEVEVRDRLRQGLPATSTAPPSPSATARPAPPRSTTGPTS